MLYSSTSGVLNRVPRSDKCFAICCVALSICSSACENIDTIHSSFHHSPIYIQLIGNLQQSLIVYYL